MKGYSSLILCQPDNKKGCSACCGLMNLKDISKDNLKEYLSNYKERKDVEVFEKINDYKYNENDYNHLRDSTAHLCQFQGFISLNKPGCMVHPLSNEGVGNRDLSLYEKNICDQFLCPSHYLLSEEYKKTIVECIDDWYLYTIAIIDPDTFMWICDISKEKYLNDNINFKKLINKLLIEQSKILNKYSDTVFFYSVSEYRLAEKNFSAGSMSKETENYRERFLEIVNNYTVNIKE